MYGELRLEGIHAGNRLSDSPFTATKGFMAIATATQRAMGVLKRHGIVIQRPLTVERPSPAYLTATFAVANSTDAQLTVGQLELRGDFDPDTGAVQFRATLSLPHEYLF